MADDTSEVQRANGIGEPARNPVHRLMESVQIPPPVATESALPDRNRTILADENIYQVIRHRFEDNVSAPPAWIPRPKVYQVSGDHLYVAQLDAMRPVYVRLGPDSNPWVRIRRGMTLKRKFSKVTVMDTNATSGVSNSIGQFLTMYASVGPLVADVALEQGAKFFIGTDELVIGPFPGTSLGTLFLLAGGVQWTLGQDGGELLISNLDLANTVFFGQGPTAGVPIYPGASLRVTLRGRLAIGTNIFTLAGNANVNVTTTAMEWDRFDSVNPQAGQVP